MKRAVALLVLFAALGCRGRDRPSVPPSATSSDTLRVTPSPSESVSERGAISGACDSAIAGVYSDIKTSPETGDVGGVEVKLTCAAGTYTAAVTVAEGAPADPVEAPAQVHDTTVQITFPPDSPLGAIESLKGVVTRKRFVGRFGNDESVDLPRRH